MPHESSKVRDSYTAILVHVVLLKGRVHLFALPQQEAATLMEDAHEGEEGLHIQLVAPHELLVLRNDLAHEVRGDIVAQAFQSGLQLAHWDLPLSSPLLELRTEGSMLFLARTSCEGHVLGEVHLLTLPGGVQAPPAVQYRCEPGRIRLHLGAEGQEQRLDERTQQHVVPQLADTVTVRELPESVAELRHLRAREAISALVCSHQAREHSKVQRCDLTAVILV
mmetsp:Transcript_81816/g.210768  ORF Transcript_81816/g.210768 Transcript_81816/m.210768 type:complete len:223 (+) Transcript_81816:558-1226(+)